MRVFAIAFGTIMMVLGFLSLVLSLVGVKLSFLVFIDAGGRLLGFVMRLLMIVLGVVSVALAQTNWKEEMNPDASIDKEN